MRKYETIIAIHPDKARDGLQTEIEKVKTMLVDNGATDLEIEDWGKREFPHLAKKQSWGHYVCYSYQTENYQLIDELTSNLRIADSILKFQSHRIIDRARKFQGNPLLLKGEKKPVLEQEEMI